MKISKQHLQCSNESIKIKTKQKGTEEKQKSKYQKARTANHSMPFWIANTSHLYPNRSITYYTIPYSLSLRVLRLPYRRSRHRFGSPSVGPTNAAPKRLKLPTVTPGATSTLSISSAPLFHCHLSGLFSSPFSYASIQSPIPFASCIVPSSSTHYQMQRSISHVYFVDGQENNMSN